MGVDKKILSLYHERQQLKIQQYGDKASLLRIQDDLSPKNYHTYRNHRFVGLILSIIYPLL